MKKIVTLILIIGFIKNSSSQTPNWLWAMGGGGGSYQQGFGISVSPLSGDIFLGARMAGTISLGGKTATGAGSDDPVSGRFDKSGNCTWLKAHNYSSGFNYIYAFCRNNLDNTFTTGALNSGGVGFYIDKYNSLGTLQWNRIISKGAGYGLVADKAGNVFVSGAYSGAMNFGITTLNSTGGSTDIFLAKFDSTGICKWAVTAGGSGYDVGRQVVLDQAGNIYLCGVYTQTPIFGTVTPPAATGNGNFFIARYDSSGNAQWVTTASNAGYTSGSYQFWEYWYLGIDSCANLYATGHFKGTAQFGTLSITSAGAEDVFVAKCLNNGKWEWANHAGGAASDAGLGIALDKYNDVYVTGSFGGTAQFGSQTITSSGGSDAFVAKYANHTGEVLWVQKGGGPSDDYSQAISIDDKGYIYISGSYNGTSTFGSSSFTAAGTGNIFVAKLDTIPPRHIVPHPSPVYCPGSTALLPFDVIGTFNAGNIFTVELSDTNGSFTTPVTLGSFNNTSSGSISIAIPSNISQSSNYIIRITSSNPAYSSHYFCNTVTIDPILTSYLTVAINGSLAISVSNDTTVCSGSTVQLNASGGTTYTWLSSASLNCTTCANPVATPATSSTYIVNVTDGSCSATDSVVIQIGGGGFSAGTISAARDTICEGTPGSLTVTGSTGPLQWQSATSGTFTDIINDTTVSIFDIPAQTTFYRVIAGTGSCADTSMSYKLVVAPSPVAKYNYTISGSSSLHASFNSDSSIGATIYDWDFGDGNKENGVQNPSHDYAKSDTFHVCLTVYNGSNCSFTICRDIQIGYLNSVTNVLAVANWRNYNLDPVGNKLMIHGISLIDEIEINDLLGRNILSQPVSTESHSVTIDVSNLPSGIYFVTLNKEKERMATKKFVRN